MRWLVSEDVHIQRRAKRVLPSVHVVCGRCPFVCEKRRDLKAWLRCCFGRGFLCDLLRVGVSQR